MMRIFSIFLFLASVFSSQAQLRNSWAGKYGKFYLPFYQHKTDAPSTSNPPIVVFIGDSLGSTTVPNGMYSIDSLGQHPFSPGSSGGGGAGGMVIGNSVGGGTSGSVLYVDGSNNLGQNNSALWWDVTNLALGINNNSPYGDLDVFHNESGSKIPGLILSREYSGAGCEILDSKSGRGSRSSPLGPSANDTIFWVKGDKWNGSVWQNIADMYAKVVGTPSTTNMPSELHFRTSTNTTPSVITEALAIGDDQIVNANKMIVGTANTSISGYANRGQSILDIYGPDPNLSYGFHLMLTDNEGMGQGLGPKYGFNTEYITNQYVGGGYMKGYKSNGTSGDYSAGLDFFTRKNGSTQARVMRLTENQNMIIGGDSVDNGERLKIVGLSQDSTTSIGVLTHETDSGTHNISFPKLAGKLQPYISSPPIWRATANGFQYSNSTTQTSLLPTSSIGSLTVAANTMYAGESFTFAGWGYVQTNATSQALTISHTVSGMGTPFSQILILPNFSGSSTSFQLTSSITILSIGSSGSCMWNFTIVLPNGNTIVSSGNAGSINTTVANTFDFKATWGTASASNGIALGAPLLLKIE